MSRTRPARAYLKVDHYLLGGHDAVTAQLYNAEAKNPTCAVIQHRVFSWHLTQADQFVPECSESAMAKRQKPATLSHRAGVP
jgi:hypothetical protein